MAGTTPVIPVIPFCIASLLAVHGEYASAFLQQCRPGSSILTAVCDDINPIGKRKKSLSPSGAAAAFVIGFLTMAAPLRTFRVSLIVFYLVGSRATKVGKALKDTLEEGHEEAGYRDAMQVSFSISTLLPSHRQTTMLRRSCRTASQL